MARKKAKSQLFINLFTKHYLFLIVLIICLTLRLYRLDELTTFGGDQGQDFIVVRDMVVFHKWTLLGIKTSVAEFFQGPVYLYLLFPLFWLLKLNPLAGPLTAVLMAALATCVIYITGIKFFSQRVALISSMFFAVSPAFVRYGNTPLYQNFLPLFLALSLLTYLTHARKQRWKTAVVLGILAGICMELHFLAISLAATFFFIFLFKKYPLKNTTAYLGGLLIGLSPTLFFELRHNFLNTHLFLSYISGSHRVNESINFFTPWIDGATIFLGGNVQILGIVVLIVSLFGLWKIKESKNKSINHLQYFIKVLIGVLAVLTIVMPSLLPHYLLPFWIALLFLLPLAYEHIFKQQKLVIGFTVLLICVNFLSTLRPMSANHGYDMPAGWTMKKAITTGELIANDAKKHPQFNVAFLLDGNTRTYPLRFVLLSKGVSPMDVTAYPQSNHLYVVSTNDRDDLFTTKIWEVKSLRPFKIGKTWDLGDNNFLYRLDRIL